MKRIISCILALALTLTLNAQIESKKINSYSNGVNKWTVQVNPEKHSKEIDYVEYNLDGVIYKNPTRTVSDSTNNYSITVFGADNTNIQPVIYYKDGTRESNLITLSAADVYTLKLENTAQRLGENNWDWQAFIVGDEKELNSISKVTYILHESFNNPYQTIEEKGTDPGKAFLLSANGWGTFNLKAKVFLKSGESLLLEHMLVFNSGEEVILMKK